MKRRTVLAQSLVRAMGAVFLGVVLLGTGLLMTSATGHAAEPAVLTDGQILRGRFTQDRTLKGFEHPLRSTGRFSLVPGLGLIWQTETPLAQTTVIGPGGLMQQAAGGEPMRLPAARMPFMVKLYTMLNGALSGKWTSLDSLFTITRTGTADAWALKLVPLKADDPLMPFQSIAVTGGRFVTTVTMSKASGDSDRLEFLDQILNTGTPTTQERALLDAVRP